MVKSAAVPACLWHPLSVGEDLVRQSHRNCSLCLITPSKAQKKCWPYLRHCRGNNEIKATQWMRRKRIMVWTVLSRRAAWIWRCCYSLSGLPGCQRNSSSLCQDFSNKSLQRGSRTRSCMSRSVKFDWQNMEVIKGITRWDRFTASWEISLDILCCIAWPLICWHSWSGVRGRGRES